MPQSENPALTAKSCINFNDIFIFAKLLKNLLIRFEECIAAYAPAARKENTTTKNTRLHTFDPGWGSKSTILLYVPRQA